jgi:hypothetical protein
MKFAKPVLVSLLILQLCPMYARSQEKPATEAATEAQPVQLQIPLKVQIVISEYDGEKKVSSMPYTMSLTASHADKRDSVGSLRVGVRVPVATSTAAGPNNMQYIDVGTNIDCWVWPWTGDRYLVSGRVEVSSLLAKSWSGTMKEPPTADATPASDPLLRQTRGDFSIALRDGQQGEPLTLTDPISGHTFKIDVTLNVLK